MQIQNSKNLEADLQRCNDALIDSENERNAIGLSIRDCQRAAEESRADQQGEINELNESNQKLQYEIHDLSMKQNQVLQLLEASQQRLKAAERVIEATQRYPQKDCSDTADPDCSGSSAISVENPDDLLHSAFHDNEARGSVSLQDELDMLKDDVLDYSECVDTGGQCIPQSKSSELNKNRSVVPHDAVWLLHHEIVGGDVLVARVTSEGVMLPALVIFDGSNWKSNDFEIVYQERARMPDGIEIDFRCDPNHNSILEKCFKPTYGYCTLPKVLFCAILPLSQQVSDCVESDKEGCLQPLEQLMYDIFEQKVETFR